MGAAALVAVILACGVSPILNQAPASALSLGISFQDVTPPGTVSLAVSFGDGKQSVRLSGKQRLSCDGVDLIPRTSAKPLLIATGVVTRQPPGGTYMCIYTDENGKRTTFYVPEPTGQLAITSPRAGAKVPIPWRSESPWYLATPAATPEAPVLHSPFAVAYTLPDRPAQQQTASIVATVEGCASATDVATCGVVAEAREEYPAQDGTFRVSDDSPLPAGYDHLSPGPGQVSLAFRMSWQLAPQGFRSLDVDVEEQVTTAFTWVAAT
jgi:hypothetical protein